MYCLKRTRKDGFWREFGMKNTHFESPRIQIGPTLSGRIQPNKTLGTYKLSLKLYSKYQVCNLIYWELCYAGDMSNRKPRHKSAELRHFYTSHRVGVTFTRTESSTLPIV
jgi:hypothetical protein